MKVQETNEFFGIPIANCHFTRIPGDSKTVVAHTTACLNDVPGNPRPLLVPRRFEHLHPGMNHLIQPEENVPFINVEVLPGNEEAQSDSEEASSENEEALAEEVDDDIEEEPSDVESSTWENGENTPGNEPLHNKEQPVQSDQNGLLNTLSSFTDRMDMAYFPHDGCVKQIPRDRDGLHKFLTRGLEFNDNPDDVFESQRRTTGLHLLRTYEKDIELIRCQQPREFGPKEARVLCGQALTSGRIHPGIRSHFTATSRLSMIAHMPELSAVAIGSPIGRVLLLTLTRKSPPLNHPEMVFEHGFRVDWILPTMEQETRYRKPARPLHGIAVGPVHDSSEDAGRNPQLPCRYRLMIHYRTHDILSYEITRHEETGKLCIF